MVVKHTFIDFQLGEHDYQLRRTKSAPSLVSTCVVSGLADVMPSKLYKVIDYPEAATPTTCASVNGDDYDTITLLSDDVCSISEVCFSDEVACIAKAKESWADVVDEESGRRKHRGGRVRSGRTRQREARRRRMRTPSPEMRVAYY